MTPGTLAIIASYLMCSEAAEVRFLAASEIETCTSLYQEVKLGFVPGIGIDEYQWMSAADRAEINRQGYLGYIAWRASNPDLVTEMEEFARRRLAELERGSSLQIDAIDTRSVGPAL